MKEAKQRRKKERTWAEAARLVLENYSDGPMTPKQILQVIETEGLKEMSGTSPLACLNAMLHSNSRGCDGLFYKLPGRISLFTLKKDAMQWSRNLSTPEGEELDDAVDAESSGSNEASTVSGDNDVSLDDTSSNASCSTEPQSRSVPAVRESHRAAAQASKQKKKAGMMLPRVVLTPLKVNGAHMETSPGFTGRQAGGESSSSSALCSTTARNKTEIARDPPQLFRGFRKPTGGQMKRNRGDDVDFETPGSILVNTNLRALINSRTFNVLPLHFQQQLLHLLPEVDRQTGTDGLLRLSGSALNNEFFTHAAQSWRERLADGEFTHEMQVRIRQEMEKEKKMEQWKERFFEDYYGQKLGLTREESQPENAMQDDAENRTASPVQEEPTRLHRGPVTRQRDGHFKKRPLRCRTRRSLYKLREPEQAEATKEVLPVESEFPDGGREAKPEMALSEGRQASPEPETLPEATKLLSKVEDGTAAAGRIPSLPQEPQDQESKEQKRKCFEQAASASFPEKKPRLEDRQSFRNTIESVHPEKPQPTKEEPKVPPIRIQLSRIKPPWVVKGQPTYQICPRIIPNTESSGQDRTRTSTAADFKACSLQDRVQREAVAPATGIGGGGGPGGGRTTDEGGGGGSGSRDRRSRSRPKCWRSKRTHGKCVSNLQRAQLLPPSNLEGESGFELAEMDSSACRREASPPSSRGDLALGQAASISLEVEGAAQHAQASGSTLADAILAKLPLDCVATEKLESCSKHLPPDIIGEHSPNAVAQEGCNKEAGRELSCSWLEDPPGNPLGDSSRAEGQEGESPIPLNCHSAVEEITVSTLGYSAGLASESKKQDWVQKEEGLDVFGHCAGQHLPDPRNSYSAGKEDLPPQRPGKEQPAELQNADKEEASLTQPASISVGLNTSHGRDTPESLLQLSETLLGAGTEAALQRTSFASDAETRSVVSETTESASDLEAELTDENWELEQECGKVAARDIAPCQSHVEKYNGIQSEYSVQMEASVCSEDLPSEAGGICQRRPWRPQQSLPQRASEFSPHVGLESLKRPHSGTPKPLSSVEVSNPLVVQLLKGSPPGKTILPGINSGLEAETASFSLSKSSTECPPFPLGGKGSGCLTPESPLDDAVDVSGTVRNGYRVPRSLQDSLETLVPGPVPLPEERPGKEGLDQTHPTLNLGSDAIDRTVGTPQKPETLTLSRGTCSFSTAPVVSEKTTSTESVPSGIHEEKIKSPPSPRFLSPSRISLYPDQLSGESAQKNHEVHGKKVFGSSFPCNAATKAQYPRALEPFPILGMLSHSKPAPKSTTPGDRDQVLREDWAPKQRSHVGGGGVENKNILACSGSAKRNVDKRKKGVTSPAEPMEHLQSVPLARDLPFFKLPREPGKSLAQPLEPSSIPSQLNIKQAFYGKLSKLQLNSASLHYASNAPVFPKSLAGSMIQLSHKANFAGSRGLSLSAQMFADSSRMEEISLKCSCSLKAMIMCKGCGAFCHDDCIGPSKLCVLCLVVR
ncbi:polycomb group protein ASXL1 [Tiliqua scincoides]|uniref:polycomb group protein ASXL1 n=1 Tax=Tiliqua scincoides TaxID=71010 RepID=UPI003462D7D9